MIRTLTAAAMLFVASLAFAAPMQTALTPAGELYAIAPDGDLPLLELTRRSGDSLTTLLVPGTEDPAVESHPRIAWDDSAKQLFVVWHRNGEDGDSIRVATLSADGKWSEPITISGCSVAKRAGLQVALGHVMPATQNEPLTTVLHVAWWKLAADGQTPEYALVAFENGANVSTEVVNLIDLSGVRSGNESDLDDSSDALHPPLAIGHTAVPSEVEIVFGSQYTTSLTRVKVIPKKIASQTRMWRPGRVGGGGLPKAGLVSSNSEPVQSFLSNGRVVLYTPDEQFRYVVYEKGSWTPMRMIKLDEKLSGEELVDHIKRAIEDAEESNDDNGATNE